MTSSTQTLQLGDRSIHRMGYGAMQLAGPGVFGPPKDRAAALEVLRTAIELGIDHIDTSDFYGPHVTNQLIREALAPYPGQLTIVTKVGARRDAEGGWQLAASKAELTQAVYDNLENLGLERLDVVNFRAMFDTHGPAEGSIGEPFAALAELRDQGLIGHLGVSNVTAAQVEEAMAIAPVVCVQNHYNLVHRQDDDLIRELATQGIAYVPFFPLGGFQPLQSSILNDVARRLEATPMQVALAWLLQRSPNIALIPGTASAAHLKENWAVRELTLPPNIVAELDAIPT